MKTIKYIAAFLVVLATAATAIAQATFEGEIRMSTSNKELNETAQVQWLIKGVNNKLVFTTVTKGEAYTYTIIITENNMNGVMLAEANGKKTRYDIPLAAINNAALVNYYKFVETENTDNVAGYTTKQVVIEAPGTTTTCKVAEVKGLKPANFPLMFKVGGIMKAFTDKNYNAIPLSIATLDARTGELKYTQNIESITARPIGDNEFVIGAEWQQPGK